jgi:hypothetical protein
MEPGIDTKQASKWNHGSAVPDKARIPPSEISEQDGRNPPNLIRYQGFLVFIKVFPGNPERSPFFR